MRARPEYRAGARKSIVAATDFSPLAAAAARRAAEVACAHDARLALVHVVSPVGRMVAPLLGAMGMQGRLGPGEALERLRHAGARLMAEFGLPVEPHLSSGAAPAAIVAHAQAADAQLIVLAAREGGLLVELLRLNAAHRIRQRTPIPVLAVGAAAHEPYRTLVLAADLSPDAAHAGRVARRLFPHAELHVVHACQPVYEGALGFAGVGLDVIEDYRRGALEEAQRHLQRFAADAGLGYAPILEARLGDPAACIREYAREVRADVLVLRPARSWLARGMAPSVTGGLLADPPCDALLVG